MNLDILANIRLPTQKPPLIIGSHRSTWDTTKPGGSNNDQIRIPTEGSGTYNCEVFWGDGSSDVITTWNDTAWTHTYASSGVYQIEIMGTCHGFRFVNSGDRLKLLSIDNGGKDFCVGSSNGQFYGCSNLTKVVGLDTSNVTTMENMFRNCSVLNCDLTSFNTSNVTNMRVMFANCIAFNGDVSSFNVSNVAIMGFMFFGCPLFNRSLNNFDTNLVTDMSYMLESCTNFNQDISNFNMESVTNVVDMLNNATSWSTENYGLFLNEIANNQNVVDSLSFRCSSKYPASAAAARADLISTDLWTITDLGAA